jgi:hypothetical protein
MLNPWTFGLESVHQAWRAQSEMAFRLVRLFGGGDPDQSAPTPLIQDTGTGEIKAQEEVPTTVADAQKTSAAITDVRRHKDRKLSHISKSIKPRSVSKRAAAARASKVVRRSKRTP